MMACTGRQESLTIRQFRMAAAFTLVELLIVAAIIATLMALILGGIGLLRENAETLETRQRLQEIERRTRETASAQGTLTDPMQSLMRGKRLEWKPLRYILERLKAEYGLDYKDAADTRVHMPPGLMSLYDDGIGCWGKEGYEATHWLTMNTSALDGIWSNSSRSAYSLLGPTTIPRVTVWCNFLDHSSDRPYQNDAGKAWHGTPYYKVGGGNQWERTGYWWHRGIAALKPVYKDNGVNADRTSTRSRYCWMMSRDSTTGEKLDSTLEILPPAKVPQSWYRQEWPILHEEIDGELLVQNAWPDSDWDQAVPGTVAPVWEMPWGKRILSRVDGSEVDQYLIREVDAEHRSLTELSPLATPGFLQLIGILPPGEAGLTAYREERNRDRAWNDRWGNPLVIGAALFIAPRYYLDPQQLLPDSFWHDPNADADKASHELNREFSTDLNGGRDWLMRTCQERYGFSRCTYLSPAALGPVRGVYGDDNPIASVLPDWDGTGELLWTDDPTEQTQVLRAAWLQVLDLCGGEEWRDEHFSDRLWEGARKGKRGAAISFLSAPIEIR